MTVRLCLFAYEALMQSTLAPVSGRARMLDILPYESFSLTHIFMFTCGVGVPVTDMQLHAVRDIWFFPFLLISILFA